MRKRPLRDSNSDRDALLQRLPSVLTTKRTVLRPITMDDALQWKTFNNAINRRMQSWPIVPSIVYARNEILHYLQMRDEGKRLVYSIVMRDTGRVIGDFHLKTVDAKQRRVEFGHALHPDAWGTGITYETLNAIRRAVKSEGYTPWAKVEETNIRSWSSLEKYGAKFLGLRTTSVGGRRVRVRCYELC